MDEINFSELISDLKKDLIRYRLIDPFRPLTRWYLLKQIPFAYGLQAITVYRFGKWIEKRFLSAASLPVRVLMLLIYDLSAWFIRNAYGIDLSLKANIEPGLYIGHFGGIEIGPCSIGRNCSIQQHVKILPDQNSGKLPYIGDYVWIGAHSKIGGCTIFDRATIAAGTHIKNDVGYKNLVAGNPPRVVFKNYNNNELIGINFR